MTGNEKDRPDDDPWAGYVFDEEFVKGGRHEPPARTRESIARYGGERTSWRQGALLEPAPTKRRSRRGRRGWLVVAAVIGVVGLGWYVVSRVSPAPEIPVVAMPTTGPAIAQFPVPDPATSAATIAASQIPTDEAPATASPPSESSAVAQSSATPTDVFGLSELDAVGTCYLEPPTDDQGVQLTTVDCTAAHNLELVSHRSAADDAVEYPGEDYWDTVVGDACQDDLVAYLGAPVSAWPAGLGAQWAIPQQESWAFGDRHIYCMFRTEQLVSTPVRG